MDVRARRDAPLDCPVQLSGWGQRGDRSTFQLTTPRAVRVHP